MSINYKGVFIQKLEETIEKNYELSLGEVLFQFLHKPQIGGKHYFYATDEEIHSSLERFCKNGVEQDNEIEE